MTESEHAAASADESIQERLRAAVTEVAATMGFDEMPILPATSDLDDMARMADLALEMLTSSIGVEAHAETEAVRNLGSLVLEVHQLLLEFHANSYNQRVGAFADVQDALFALPSSAGVATLLDAAPAELVRSCGFDQAFLFRVDGTALMLESLHGEPGPIEELRKNLTNNPPQLKSGSLESEALRRRQALLQQPERDESSCLGWIAKGASACAVAPVISEGRAAGLFAVDRSTRPLSGLDRDALWAFSVGFGHLVERALLRERLSSQRDRIRSLARDLDLVAGSSGSDSFAGRWAGDRVHDQAIAEAAPLLAPTDESNPSGLSPREIDVMEVMVSGATNNEIAERLFISEDTVKTHVKRILRKLGATNRIDAVSRFVQRSAR